MFNVYTDKVAFEEIILFKEEMPNLASIFFNNSDICLNLDDAEMEAEFHPGTAIFEFIHATGGRTPIALKSYFEEILEDPLKMIEKPRSLFILDIEKGKAEQIQMETGILVIPIKDLNDQVLKGCFYKNLEKDIIIESNGNIGWKCLFQNINLPSNSLIIADNYLFANDVKGEIIGKINTVNLLDAILPTSLTVPFHLLIIAQDNKMPKEWCEKLVGNLNSELKALRPYPISLEVIFSEAIHKRKAISNYFTITCDKGFALFKVNDKKTVRSNNDIRIENLFDRNKPYEGDSVFASNQIDLKQIKDISLKVKDYINKIDATYNKRILGDCKKDKTINNRLLNDL